MKTVKKRKKNATLPASACPEMHTYHYPQDGRWYLEIMANGDVYLTVRQSGGVGKGLSCSFIVPYVLKISGGGIKSLLNILSPFALWKAVAA